LRERTARRAGFISAEAVVWAQLWGRRRIRRGEKRIGSEGRREGMNIKRVEVDKMKGAEDKSRGMKRSGSRAEKRSRGEEQRGAEEAPR
jgi:hypothetical protein